MTVAAQAAKATAWSKPAFRYLLGSDAVTLSGSAVSTVALPALAVVELHASTTEVAVLAFFGQLPNAVALWAGALSDRRPKRLQMIASDLAAAGALVTIPAAALAGALTVGQLCAVGIVLGVAKVLRDAAAISLLPALVDPGQLHDANSKIGAVSSVADSAGTNAGAALVGAVGPARSVLADAMSFVVSAVLVRRMRVPEAATVPRARTSLARDIADGVRYVARQPTIRTVIAALSTLSFGLAVMNTYWAYYLLDRLGASPSVARSRASVLCRPFCQASPPTPDTGPRHRVVHAPGHQTRARPAEAPDALIPLRRPATAGTSLTSQGAPIESTSDEPATVGRDRPARRPIHQPGLGARNDPGAAVDAAGPQALRGGRRVRPGRGRSLGHQPQKGTEPHVV
ncbi:MFS transporter [Streptomyces lavendulocolor]|uniref:MFS transporter n=1 Tax=Streptomyces lavendulocolor TaxID=67316 RepID=UPI0031CDBD38